MSQKFIEVWVTTLESSNNELTHMRQRIVACIDDLFLLSRRARVRALREKEEEREERRGERCGRESGFALCLCGSKQRELRTLGRRGTRRGLRARPRDGSGRRRAFRDRRPA